MSGVRWLDMGPWPVFVGFTTDEAAYCETMARLRPGDDVPFLARDHAAATCHRFYASGRLTFLLTMVPRTRSVSREQYAALLAHEAVHVVQRMREELCGDGSLGEEAEAYLVQQIVQEGLQEAWHTGRVRATEP